MELGGVKGSDIPHENVIYSIDTENGIVTRVEILTDDNGYVTGTYKATALIIDGEQIMPGGDNVVRISGSFRRKLEPVPKS